MITRKMWSGKDSVRNTSDDRKGDPDPTSNVNKAKSPTQNSERKEDDPDPTSSTDKVKESLTKPNEGMMFKLLTLAIIVGSQ